MDRRAGAGPGGAAMVAARPAMVRVIVPADPPEAARLMFRPLELAHVRGPPAGGAGRDSGHAARRGRRGAGGGAGGERLRVLGLFSLPAGGTPLNLRRERQALVRLFAGIAAGGPGGGGAGSAVRGDPGTAAGRAGGG